jgi:HSP20 family protein
MKRFTYFAQTFSRTEHGFGAQSPSGAEWEPLVDIYQRPGVTTLVVELPGMSESDVSLSIENGRLIIAGQRRKFIPADTCQVQQVEIPHGPFRRAVQLTAVADIDKITARMDNGYLVIHVPEVETS